MKRFVLPTTLTLIKLASSGKNILTLLFALITVSLTAQIIGDTSVCAHESALYTIPPQPGATFQWTVTGGSAIGTTTNDSLLVNWGNAGTGTLLLAIYTNAGTIYWSLNVTIHPLPVPVISHAPYQTCPSDPGGQGGSSGQPDNHNTCENVCEFSTITYSTPLHTGSTYQWLVNGALNYTGAATNVLTVTWDSTLYGSLTVIETNQWGCIDSASICIKKVKRPTAYFTSQSSVCLNTPTQFNNYSTGATSYAWYFGDGNTSTSFSPSHAYANAGTYTVTLIAYNDCHCTDTFQRTITVDSLPGPDITCPATVCAGDTQTYSTGNAGCIYQWGAIGGTILGSSTQQQVTVAWGPGSLGTLWLYVTGCTALCSDTTFVFVPIVPSTDTIYGPNKVCSPSCATFNCTFFSGATYTWNLTGGGTITSQSCNDVTICWPPFYQANDTLTVAYYDSFLGCGGTASKIIRVRSEMGIIGQSPVCVNSFAGYSVNPSVNCIWSVSPAGPTILGNFSPNITINWNGLAGNYVISAVPLNPNAVCNDSAVLPVTVIPLPPAPPITGDTIICPGNSYSYCSSAGNGVHWIVTGGTPASSIGSCVTVTWNNTGPYSIGAYLQMNNSPFCYSDTTLQAIYSALPLANPTVLVPPGTCANNSSVFTCTTLYPAGTTFNWAVSPSNAGAITGGQGSPSVTVQWGNNPGPVNLVLTVTACSQQIVKTVTINLSPTPTPSITQNGLLCPGVPAQLNATGGTYIGFSWSGPLGYSNNVNPATITTGGLYHVTVTDNNNCTAITQFTAVSQPAPVASISTSDFLQYCINTPFAVTLNALTNPGYTFAWSSGPTTNPLTVTAAGSYNVTVTDANGCTALSNTLTILIDSCNGGGGGTGGPCVPNGSISFAHPVFYGCNPLSFTNTSVNGSSYSWDFGDFTYSNVASPSHSYTQAGFYLVVLKGYVPNVAGTDSCLLSDTAHVEVPLLPAFKYVLGCLGTPDSFFDISAFTVGNNITTWNWNFGDAGTSTLQNPTHVYSSAGTYIVTLTVGNGTCTATVTDTINVPALPVAAFNAPLTACANSSILFTDASTPAGAINLWSWSFGDGGTSLNQNPTHSYATAGTDTVQLAVRDTLGCVDTVQQILTIVNPTPIGNITFFPDTEVCAGTPVLLVAPFCTGCTYSWTGGSTNDSIWVTTTGIYVVVVTDPNGCQGSAYVHVIVHPAPPAVIYNTGNDELCMGEFTSLNTTYSLDYTYLWLSNDTLADSTNGSGVFVQSLLLGPGVYTYTVIITDTTTGCFDTSAPYFITVHPLPVPPVITAVGVTTFCEGDSVLLIGSHPDSTVTLQWSNGDVNDSIWVSSGGTYTLTAIDSNGCEADTSMAINVNPMPDVCAFWEGCLDTCAPFTICAPAGNTYQWLLNDTAIAGATNQCYTATLNGTYTVILTNSFGCIDTTGPLNLSLHPCEHDSLCAELVIDSVGCDTLGHPNIWYHVTNYSGDELNQFTFTVLAPNQNTIYGPVTVYENVLNNSNSSIHQVAFYTAQPGDTMCFKVHVEAYDSLGEEVMCCNTDTQCVVFPPCPEDTIPPHCCYFQFISDSVDCEPRLLDGTIISPYISTLADSYIFKHLTPVISKSAIHIISAGQQLLISFTQH